MGCCGFTTKEVMQAIMGMHIEALYFAQNYHKDALAAHLCYRIGVLWEKAGIGFGRMHIVFCVSLVFEFMSQQVFSAL